MDEIEDKQESGDNSAEQTTDTTTSEKNHSEFQETSGAEAGSESGEAGSSADKETPPPTPPADQPADSSEDQLAYAQVFYDKIMGMKDGMTPTQKVKIPFHDYKKLYRAKLTETSGDNQPLKLKDGPLLEIDTTEGAKAGIFDFTIVE